MAEVGITIPTELINDLVRAAIVRELGNQTALIEGVVNAAMSAKESNYSSKTFFQATTEKLIRGVADEALKEWIETQREAIKAAFLKYLTSRDGAATKKLIDAMMEGVGRYQATVQFKWD